MLQWDDVSVEARETMRLLGHFKPTVYAENKEVKGWIEEEGKTYINSADLRVMAVHFLEVADWLDKRADAANKPG